MPVSRPRSTSTPLRGFVFGVLLAAGIAQGAAVPPVDEPPTWASLSPQHQAALAPLQRDWATISTRHKERWIRLATRLPSMPADERQRVQDRMTQWARMSAAERSEARLRYQQSRQLSPDQRKARWEAYQALSPEQRQALARHAEAEGAGRAGAAATRDGAKRNLVPPDAPAAMPTPVVPAVVRAAPGATTSPLSQPPPLPDHQQAGLPKIAAVEGFVEPNTLLPQRGPQAAAVRGNAAAGRAPHER